MAPRRMLTCHVRVILMVSGNHVVKDLMLINSPWRILGSCLHFWAAFKIILCALWVSFWDSCLHFWVSFKTIFRYHVGPRFTCLEVIQSDLWISSWAPVYFFGGHSKRFLGIMLGSCLHVWVSFKTIFGHRFGLLLSSLGAFKTIVGMILGS